MSRLDIDWTRCDGHGLCARMLPENIMLDEWGFPIIESELDASVINDARRAASVCPALALRVTRA